jgi:hypothetical protein
LRNEFAQHPETALIAVVHALAAVTFHDIYKTCLEISLRSAHLSGHAPGIDESPAMRAIAERHEAWRTRLCPRARELVGTLIPRGLSFTFGLISKIVKKLNAGNAQPELDMQMIEALAAAIRKGYDSPAKLFYASQHRSILSRVQMHAAFAAETIP